jgi:hypothetical protein
MNQPLRKWRLGNHKALSNFFEFASEQIKESPITIEIVPEKRNLDQNAMIYALYTQIASQKQDMTVGDIKRHCKLHIGIPILRQHDEQFRKFYNEALLHREYEVKLAAMDYMPVTSIMNKKVCAEYITELMRYWSEQGIYIQLPGDEE